MDQLQLRPIARDIPKRKQWGRGPMVVLCDLEYGIGSDAHTNSHSYNYTHAQPNGHSESDSNTDAVF